MLPIHVRSLDDYKRLVTLGSTPESVGLEFKAVYEKAASQEIRKDVLALANTWGGTILVGVSEKRNTRGESVASGLVPQRNIEELKRRINDALASKVFPAVRVETWVIAAPQEDGSGDVSILSVCVSPLADGLAAYEDENDSGCLRFPYRDNIGVKFFAPAEVTKRMDTRSRRMMIRAREVGLVDDATVHVASPVLFQRVETENERIARIGHEIKNRLRTNQGAQIVQGYLSNPRGFVRAPTEDQFSLSINSYAVDVPFGAVRELWSMGASIGIALECEIHLIEAPQPAAFLRYSSR